MGLLARIVPIFPIFALTAATACTQDDTSIQIRFLVDPTLNTEQQVLLQVDRLELVLDAPQGFAGVTSAGQSFPPFTAVNTDQDSALELVVQKDVASDSSLPLVRLLPGSNLDCTFSITARGWKGTQVTALGGAASVRFRQGSHEDLPVPFNLRAGFRAPRVVISQPHDGQQDVPAALGQVYLAFSRPVTVDPQSSQLSVVYDAAGGLAVPGSWQLSSTKVYELGMPETRTVATLKLAASCPSLSPGSYRIEASTKIVDSSGNRLDQDAGTTQPDPFTASFTISGTPTGSPCGATPGTCASDKDCGSLQGFVCQLDATGGSLGKCVPGTTDCAGIQCETQKGYICIMGSDGSDGHATCVPDCRVFGCGSNAFCQQDGTCSSNCSTPDCKPPPAVCEACREICNDPQQTGCQDCLKQNNCL